MKPPMGVFACKIMPTICSSWSQFETRPPGTRFTVIRKQSSSPGVLESE